jgi:N utilization substance protein A
MNKEILMVVDAVSNEKGVDKEIIFEALEAALASATRKKHGEDWDVRVAINRKTGDYETFRRWKVFSDDSTELENPTAELRLDDARDLSADVEPGGYVEEPMESVAFGRIAAQQAKQVIVQKVREAERAQVVDAYKERVNTLVNGVVKRIDRNGIYVDLGSNAEGFVPRTDMIPREQLKPQDRVKAYLREVRAELRGPQLFLTRTAPEFLIELFKLEVPEVGQGLIQILAAARDSGCAPRSRCAARIRVSIRSAPVSACAARACRRSPTRLPASASTSFPSTRTRRSSSSTPCPRPRCSRSWSMRTRTAWTSRSRRRSCRRRSAAAARTSASPASSPAGN